MSTLPTSLFVLALSLCASAQKPSLPKFGTQARSIQVGSTEREFLLHVPKQYSEKQDVPLVFVLHGRGGSGTAASRNYGWTPMAEKHGFLLVYPTALGEPTSWKTQKGSEDDIDTSFIRAMIVSLSHELRVDRKRIYCCGHSSGGFMSYSVAASLGDQMAAVGVVAGSIGLEWRNRRRVIQTPTQPVPVITFHGYKDMIVPYDKVHGKGARYGMILSVHESIAFWVKANGCSEDASREELFGGRVIKEHYASDTNKDVLLFSLTEGNHGWPGAMRRQTSKTISATEEIWKFFASHAREELSELPETYTKTERAKVTANASATVTLEPSPLKVERVATGYGFTEGPAWDPKTRSLLFTDIRNNQIIKLSDGDKASVFQKPSGKANGLMFDKSGVLYACLGGSRQVVRINPDGKRTVLADKYQGKQLNSPNDLALDGSGGLYFTDPRYGSKDNMELDLMCVYYIARDGKLSRVINTFERPNGIVVSNDGKTLFVAEPNKREIHAFAITAPGRLGEGQLWFRADKKRDGQGPDGMCFDAEGKLYATFDDVLVLAAGADEKKGAIVARIKVPEHPSNCIIGGKDGKQLFITARRSLYRAALEVKAGPLRAGHSR